MKIDYLKMKNFMLYRDFYKKFKDKDIIGIVCQYKNNKRKSNRGGKSTITEAIRYALFGSHRAHKETQLIHHGQDYMEVEVGLVDDEGRTYKVRRGRTRKGEGILECDWVDKKSEAQEEINEILGSDKKELDLTNFFKQSDINQFMELSSSDKKSYLMKWLDNDHWPKLAKIVSQDLKEKEKELSKLKTKVETLLEDCDDESETRNTIKGIEKNLQQKQHSYDELVERLNALKEQRKSKEDLKKMRGELLELEEKADEISSQIEKQFKIKEGIIDAKKLVQKLIKRKEKYGDFSEKVYQKEVKRGHQADFEQAQLQDKLRTMENEFCGVCPILEEGCDRIEKDPKQIKKWKKRIKELDKVCQESEELVEKMGKARKATASLESAQESLSQLKSQRILIKPLKKRLKSTEAKCARLTASLKRSEKSELKEKINKLTDKVQQKKLGLDGLNRKLGKYQSQLVRIQKAKKKVDKINDSVTALEREIEDLKYLAFMFGKNGIPSQEIENAFQEIEDDINFILEKMGTEMQVSFNADKELGKWEDECVGCGWRFPKYYRRNDCKKCGEPRRKKRKDELHFSVVENENETDFQMESGGGKTFVSLAVRIALTALKQRQNSSNFNVLFLDEIDSALDEDAREQIMKLVTTILMKHFGFQQIFWVSHNKAIKESVPFTLKVIRFEDYAKAKWV